ncbi:MAG TPA: CoA transferase [Dehalococcoidia bacterium]|nr:CoA transferase [Dehalococcoidia bacterium]
MGDVLAGIRVVDFSWIVAGPTATRILGNFGAEVIRIEHPTDYEMIRLWPSHPGDQVGPNSSQFFNNLNADKLGATLNVRHPKGMELLRRLIAKSDVVLENFSSRVLENWGLGYEELKKLRPDIIYVSMAGMGHSGRSRDYNTWGPSVQALSGLTHLSGLPDAAPAGWGYSYMDHSGGYFAAMAVLLAIRQRRKSGLGQWVDLAQVESAIALTGPAILDYQVNGRSSRRPGYPPGNHADRPAVAPHNTYRCQGRDEAGQGVWIAIQVDTDDQWAALCTEMDRVDLIADPRFATNRARLAHEAELDAIIADWTADKERYHLMRRLQAAKVPAGVVQTAADRVERDPQLRARQLYKELDHAEMGRLALEDLPVRLSRTPGRVRRAAPLHGEHNEYIYREILGLSDEEFAECLADGVI